MWFFDPRSLTTTPSAQISLPMEDHTLIDGEQCRRKRNNACLEKQEADHKLIAEGEGKINLSSQQNTNLSPVGPRKVKMMALKNACEFLCSRNL